LKISHKLRFIPVKKTNQQWEEHNLLPLDIHAYLNVSIFSVHVQNKVHVYGGNIRTMHVACCKMSFILIIWDIRNILSDISIYEDKKY